VISSLLVANRGEIARRVFATCRRAGIGTVAVFSDPDAGAPHVAEADIAVRLPGASPAQTYLNGQAIVAAAIAAGADAVHPGYGFLAEDHRFARQVLAAGLTWVGPPPQAMQAMAIKIEARKRAAGAGVPILADLDPATITEFPVLVKASAGGGGRGMRAVHNRAELEPALASARREAQAAFGDGTVFCEPLLTGARHIEVQVLADQAGTVWALAERDCSVQRRYQKVIEESPSPAVGPDLRERLAIAAISLARSVGYQGAGTVEFLVAGPDEFYFLEFNTRLQVEHPVTEFVHGIDLVALQLDVAQGLALPDRPPAAAGHAMQARLYAEDPADGYRPSGGPVHVFDVPEVDVRFGLPGRSGQQPGRSGQPGPALRLDSGVQAGVIVSPHYDAMLAKLISWAPDREGAARRLAAGLAGARICGPATNRDLLVSVLRDPVFAAGEADTSLLDGYDLAGVGPTVQADRLSALAAAVAVAAANRLRARVTRSIPGGWRNVVSQPQLTSFDAQRGRIDVRYHWTRTGITVAGITVAGITAPAGAQPTVNAQPDGAGSGAASPGAQAQVIAFGPERVTLEVGGVQYRFDVTRAGDQIWVDSAFGSVRLNLIERLPAPVRSVAAGSLIAPMPGSVTGVHAAPGDRLAAGQPVLVLEAMKMEHQVTGPAGVLAELRVGPGSQVNAGDVLAIVTPDEPDPTERDQ
jgi:propionyl-CoA carboxylase alpha chain